MCLSNVARLAFGLEQPTGYHSHLIIMMFLFWLMILCEHAYPIHFIHVCTFGQVADCYVQNTWFIQTKMFIMYYVDIFILLFFYFISTRQHSPNYYSPQSFDSCICIYSQLCKHSFAIPKFYAKIHTSIHLGNHCFNFHNCIIICSVNSHLNSHQFEFNPVVKIFPIHMCVQIKLNTGIHIIDLAHLFGRTKI